MSRLDRLSLKVGAIALTAALPASIVLAERPARGSVRGVNRTGNGATWSGPRTSGSTTYGAAGNTASRSTHVDGRNQSVDANRSVTRNGDEVTVNRNAQSSTGASHNSQKTYEFEDGRVESVERSGQTTDRYGRTSNWDGKAERSGNGWQFEGDGTTRYGEHVGVDGYAARGPYGAGVVADVDGRYGSRTVAAGGAYGGPVYAASLPYGARPATYYGRPYYGYAGVYYRPYTYAGVAYYGTIPPPWGVYYTTVPVGSVTVVVSGTTLLYSGGVYYRTTYVSGSTRYEVVPAPAGASLPPGTLLPADRVRVTISGITYFLYGNTFYRHVEAGGVQSFVVVTRPAGVVTVKALPEDFVPVPASGHVYFRSGTRFFLTYLDPSGEELYVVVDPPAAAAVAAAAPPAAKAAVQVAPGTPVTIRVATAIDASRAQSGQRFQGSLDVDLISEGRVLVLRGARVYGRVLETKTLSLELTDIEVGGRVVPISTAVLRLEGQSKKPARKILGGAALGAGIGALLDGGDGAAVGAGVGALTGTAAAAASSGQAASVPAGGTLEFRLAQTLRVEV